MKIILLLVIQFFQPTPKDSSGSKIVVLPAKKLIPVFTADTRAHRLSFQRNFDENSYTAGMGGIFPVLQYNGDKRKFQFSAAGSTYLTLLRQNHAGSVQNTDFFFDLFFDVSLHKYWSIRLGTGHSSQHLIDDAIIAGDPFKNYAKDFHQFMVIFRHPKYRILAYSGLAYNYNFKTSTDISNKILLQSGFEHSPFKLSKQQYIFYAADIKFRQELNFDHTLNFQIGYKLVNNNGRNLRIALDYTSGTNEIGYFQPAQRNFAHLGIYLEF